MLQAVILAAGKSSRFFPFRDFSHKSLVTILGKPVIIHTLESIKKTGIEEIIIVVSPNSEIKNVVGNGKDFGLSITYVIQNEPSGGGNGLLLAEKYIKDYFFLLNASRVDFDSFKDEMILRKKRDVSTVLLAKKNDGLSKYGALKVSGDRVVDLIEKPGGDVGLSYLRLIGVYLFSKDFLKFLEETPEEHYRLESAIARLAKKENVRTVITKEKAPSLKYSWDLLELKNVLLSKIKSKAVSKKASIAKSAEISGNVVIGDDAVVMEGAKIKGPAFIGMGSMIGTNAILRDGTSVEENSVLGANLEVKNSLIMKKTKLHSGYLGDSIIGENVRIGAQFASANKRIDRKSIRVTSPEYKEIDTQLKSLGVIIGNNSGLGIKVSTMPGVIIGSNSTIGPSTTVLKNVDSDSKFYTKFKETVYKKNK